MSKVTKGLYWFSFVVLSLMHLAKIGTMRATAIYLDNGEESDGSTRVEFSLGYVMFITYYAVIIPVIASQFQKSKLVK